MSQQLLTANEISSTSGVANTGIVGLITSAQLQPNLVLTGDTNVTGNLTVQGTSITVNREIVNTSIVTATSMSSPIINGPSTLTLQTANTTAMTIGSNQYVGIGVVPSSYYFDVYSNTGLNAIARFYNNSSGGNTDLYVNNVGSGQDWLLSRRSNGDAWMYLSSGNANMTFSTNAIERMRVANTGNIGISTSTPTSTLHVNGSLNITGVSQQSYADYIYVPKTGSGHPVGLTGGPVSQSANNIAVLRVSDYLTIQHTSFSNTPVIGFNAQLMSSDYVGSGTGTATSFNRFSPTYAAGSYGIISSVNGGISFNTGNWSGATSIDLSYLSNHASYAGGFDPSGYWYMPKQPKFHATGNGTGSTTGGYFNFPSVYTNISSSYNSSTGKFTAPVAGTYYIYASVMASSGTGRFIWQFYKNGSSLNMNQGGGDSTNYDSWFGGITVTLAAGDYIQVYNTTGTPYNNNQEQSFGGWLIG